MADGWDREFRDFTPSDDDLSDFDLNAIVTRNLDISNRYDNAEFTRTPFTIAAKRKKAVAPPPKKGPAQQAVPPVKERKSAKISSTSKKPLPPVEVDDDDVIPDPTDEYTTDQKQENEEESEEPIKKKKPKKLPYGGWSSYAEQEEMEERAARSGGGAIIPAVLQPKPTKDDKKKKPGVWRPQPNGWTNASGDAIPISAPSNSGNTNPKKRKASAPPRVPPPPSILETIARVEKENAKKPKTSGGEPAGKGEKQSAKKGKAAPKAKKGKGKKGDGEEDAIKFGRLPSGAAPNDNFPILKGFERMKSMPVKPKRIDIDKLIPLTKKDKELNKTKDKIDSLKFDSSSSKTKYKSEEFIDDDQDDESVEPPSDDETLLPSSNNQGRMFSKLFQDIKDEEAGKQMPSLDHTNPTEPTDQYLTPEATESHHGNPSTMTHLSEKNHQVSDYATSSSQLPYSSPTLDNYGRAKKLSGIVNPIPVRDQSSQLALLQKLANGGQSNRHVGRNEPAYTRRFNPDEEDIRPLDDDDEWSTLKPKASRYAQKSMSRKDDNPRDVTRTTALFPTQGPVKREETSHPKPYSKITVFQPPSRPSQAQSSGYSIAAIPNGARNVKVEYEEEDMQWKGSPRKFLEQQKPKQAQPSWLKAANAARPKPDGGSSGNERRKGDEQTDWKQEWKQPKRDVANHVLGKYAMKNEIKKKDVDSSGRAFRM